MAVQLVQWLCVNLSCSADLSYFDISNWWQQHEWQIWVGVCIFFHEDTIELFPQSFCLGFIRVADVIGSCEKCWNSTKFQFLTF